MGVNVSLRTASGLQMGTFGTDQNGKWGLVHGKVTATMDDGSVFTADVHNGQMYGGVLYDASGLTIGEFKPETGTGPLFIKGSDAQQPDSQPSFWNSVFKFFPMGMEFLFESGLLKKVDASVSSGSGSSLNERTDKPLFVLTNGINNPNFDPDTSPDYISNFTQDLSDQSRVMTPSDAIIKEDTIPTPIFQGLRLVQPDLGGNQTINNLINQLKDILHVVVEAQLSFPNAPAAIKVWSDLAEFFVNKMDWLQRSMIGVGYSGGFVPMLEALRVGSYNVTGLIALGAATLDVGQEVFSVLDLLAEAVIKIEKGVTDGLDWLIRQTIGRLPLFGDFLNGVVGGITGFVDQIIGFVASGLIGNALDKIQEMISPYLRQIPMLGSLGLAGMPVEFVVNVWGEDDILNKLKIGGYRQDIGGFTSGSRVKPLFNIEIKNGSLPDQKADHFVYQRYDSATEWDKKVSDFVAQLTVESRGSADAIRQFLLDGVNEGFISIDTRGVYVVDGSLL